MKKPIAIVAAIFMLASLCSCTVQLSTTETQPVNGAKEPEEQQVIEASSEAVSIEDQMRSKASVDLVMASASDSSLIAPAKDISSNLWGYMDLQGNWVISPAYKSADPFHGDIAAVQDLYGDYTYINRNGDVLLSALDKNNIISNWVHSEGILNIALDVDSAQNMTYVDSEGKVLFPITNLPSAKGVAYTNKNFVELASPFRNGKAVVMRAVNSTIAAGGSSERPETAYIIDTAGSLISALPQGMDVSPYGFDENMRVVITDGNGLSGLANDRGDIVAPCSYLKVLHCEGDLYLACNQDGFWGFIDKDGNKAIDFNYASALPFSDGLAAVNDGRGWGFIDETGALVIDYQFDDVEALNVSANSDPEGAGAFSCGVAVVRAGGFWGIIDANGEILVAAEADECPVLSVNNGYLSAVYGEYCGVFNLNKECILLSGSSNIGEFN